MMEVKCQDLGVQGCDEVFRGETAHDVVEEAVEHLESHHDIDMPDADTIVTGERPLEFWLGEHVDEAAALVVRRLRESLNLPSERDQYRATG